jgi:hypothetical protein
MAQTMTKTTSTTEKKEAGASKHLVQPSSPKVVALKNELDNLIKTVGAENVGTAAEAADTIVRIAKIGIRMWECWSEAYDQYAVATSGENVKDAIIGRLTYLTLMMQNPKVEAVLSEIEHENAKAEQVKRDAEEAMANEDDGTDIDEDA